MSFADKTERRRWQRKFRRRRREAIEFSQQADEQIERLLIRRFDRLVSVRRFIFLWLSLFVLIFFATFLQLRALSPYYQSFQPAPGGLYSEGLIGSFTNANPLYATGAADVAASRLNFSGLFKYDRSNQLVGDLATGYELNDSQEKYTVHLRQGVRWQDGKSFTAEDVLFTYKTIQNIEAQSPLYSSWQGINVTKIDDYTVGFELPNSLSSFPHSLINGIVPAHLLGKIPVEQLRSAPFNTAPIGTGPFQLKYIEIAGSDSLTRQQRISFTQFEGYWSGPPKLDGLSLITFPDDKQLIEAFEKKQINAMSGLESVPDELRRDNTIQAYRTPMTAAVMAFFNNSRADLDNTNVRRALVSAVDRGQIVDMLGEPAQLVNSPLLRGQLGYDPAVVQLPFNEAYANQLLDQEGWTRDGSGQRMKGGQPLSFSLSAQNTQNYTKVAQFLQKQWVKLGVKVQVSYYSNDDLQTSVIGSHSYDILLYGISIGVDPDVFAYWDSSQASLTSQGHMNLSEYKSTTADSAIEAARTRSDPTIRAVKYKAFLSAWTQDAPALGLYQPNFLYITRGPVFNYERRADNSTADRFYQVDQWMIRQQRQTAR